MYDQTNASTPPTIPISIDIDKPQDDPSGGGGIVKSVWMPHMVSSRTPDTTLMFTFKQDEGCKFTAFRYYNTSLEKWYSPQGKKGGPAPAGIEFHDLQISADGKSLSVKDKTSNSVLYLYIVEWTDAEGNIWVCDPKIKNQP